MDNTVYNWKDIGVKEITNLYLFGQKNTPTSKDLVSDKWIRPADSPPEENKPAQTIVHIDAVSFMKDGPGRFANAAYSSIVTSFFTGVYPEFLGAGVKKTFTRDAMVKIVGGKSNISLQQYNYSDKEDKYTGQSFRKEDNYPARGFKEDGYAVRSYIYNSSSFRISTDAVFVVEADGKRHIENMSVKPFDDNFDFQSDSIIATLGNKLIEAKIDPSRIGRRVDIVFENKDNIPTRDYYYEDYKQDIQREKNTFSPTLVATRLPGGIDKIVDKLWESGVTRFLYKDRAYDRELPIIYGTDEGGNFSKVPGTGNKEVDKDLWEQLYPTLAPYAKNGVVMIGGKGDDIFRNIPDSSIMYGGEGKDTYHLSTKKRDITEGYKGYVSIADPSPEDRISLPITASDGTVTDTIISGVARRDTGGSLTLPGASSVYDRNNIPANLFSIAPMGPTFEDKGAVILNDDRHIAHLLKFKSGDLGISLDGIAGSGDNNITHGLPVSYVNNKSAGEKTK